MFYKTGIDITNDKQMFNFLKNHFTYWTMSSWNYYKSIANNVKLDRMQLSGDWGVAYDLLAEENYATINDMIQAWCVNHIGCEVIFNGRSGGYLVLLDEDSNASILPDEITECEDYSEYKSYCREYYGSVKANRANLVFYTKLVQDFDRLCDQLRDYCDTLSNKSFESVAMQSAVENFNDNYSNDLCFLDFQYLQCDEQGIVDLSEIIALQSLTEAFLNLASRVHSGYSFEWLEDSRIRLKKT